MRKSILLAALLCAGCAVLKIDVDVYKGPLANHEEVQQQQLAVMAIAAKPLLLRLRNSIEWRENKNDPLLAGLSPEDRERVWSDWADVKDYSFTRPEAEQVNAVLSLYKDSHQAVAQYVERIEQLAHDYEKSLRALERFEPQDLTADAAAWSTISSDLKVPVIEAPADRIEAARRFIGEVRRRLPSIADACGTPTGTPEADYLVFLTRSFRIFIDSSYAANMTFDGGAPKDEENATVYNSDPLRIAFECLRRQPDLVRNARITLPKDQSTNAFFEYLKKADSPGDYQNLHQFTALLFRDPKSAGAAQFEHRVGDIASAFVASRAALQQLSQVSLDALVALNDPSAAADNPDLKNFDSAHPAFRRALGRLVGNIVNPKHLNLALCLDPSKPRTGWQIELAKRRHGQDFSSDWATASREIEAMLLEEKDMKGLREVLVAAGKALNDKKAISLEQAQDEPCNRQRKNFLRVSVYGDEFEFGITHGPTLEKSRVDHVITDVTLAVRRIAEGAAAGLEHGRLQHGLETLVEDYVNHFAACRDHRAAEIARPPDLAGALRDICDRQEWDSIRESLADELVHFSEKVLVIANYDILLDGQSPTGPYSTSGTLETAEPQSIRQYRLVLQAVGNSILNQLDELKFRREHQTWLRNRTTAEFETLKKANALTAQAVVEDIIRQLRAKAQPAGGAKAKGDGGTTAADPEKALADATKAAKDAQAEVDKAGQAAEPVYAAYATLTGDGTAGAPVDKTALEALLDLGDAQVKASDMLDQIIKWLQGQFDAYDANGRDDPRAKRLDAAHGYLDGRRAQLGPATSDTRRKTFEAIKANLRLNKSAQDDKIAQAKKVQKDKADAVTTAQAALQAAHMTLAADAIRGCLAAILKRSGDGNPHPADVFAATKTVLGSSDGCVSNKDGTKNPGVAFALAALRDLDPPLDPDRIYDAPPAPYENARDVLDREITALEYERIRATQEGGENSGYATQVQAAIAAAYDYRAGMAYIRPSGAYLRSSYPATALQNDPGLGWENLLGDSSLKSIPLFGRFFVNAKDEADLKIQSAIDKQFWQNINSVRVTGGGTTNYVIAKDDIGNWYVKAYDANPKPIIEAAQSLAAFGLGTKAPGLGQAAKAIDGQSPPPLPAPGAADQAQATTTKPTAPVSPLETLLDIHKSKYEKQTGNDYALLKSELGADDIASKIAAKWKADTRLTDTTKQLPDITAPLNTLLAQVKDGLNEDMKPVIDPSKAATKADQAQRVVDALDNIFIFRNRLAGAIQADTQTLPSDTSLDQRKAAVDDVDKIIGPLLKNAATRREAAVKDYSGIVTEIGQVAQ